jgi:hypothetical protein
MAAVRYDGCKNKGQHRRFMTQNQQFNRLAHAMGIVALHCERRVRRAELRAALVMLLVAQVRNSRADR